MQENLERYESIYQENQRKREELLRVRKELETVKANNKYFEEARKHLRKDLRKDLINRKDQALKTGNFIELGKINVLSQKQNKTNALYLQVNKGIEKINRLNTKNIELQNKIDKRLEAMARREALANSIFQSKVARFKNYFDEIKLNYEKRKFENQSTKLNLTRSKYNDSLDNSKHYQNLLKDKELLETKKMLEKKFEANSILKSDEKAKEIDQSKMQDFRKEEVFNPKTNQKIGDKYTHKITNVRVFDKGNSIIAKGGTDKEKAQALLKVAKEKGWNINNLVASGTKEFKEEISKQIEMEKTKKLEKIKELERQKELQEKNRQKNNNSNKEKGFSLQR